MEIQTIHLYREKEMDTDMSPKSDEQVFRATDYFDCLIAKKRTLTDILPSRDCMSNSICMITESILWSTEL